MPSNDDTHSMYEALGAGLDRNGKGEPLSNLNNAVRILEQDPVLAGTIWFDEFLQRIMTGCPEREWTDADDLNTTLYIQRDVQLPKMGHDTVSKAVMQVAFKNTRNCVKDWLEALAWDGESRIDHFFEDYYGTEATEYTRAASRNFWLSMVARVYRPGCKADNMIVLEGSQGIGKSLSLQIIGGDWFTEQHESAANPKAFSEIIQGKLLIEIGEMDSFSRTEVTRVKQVITCLSDRFRASYGRHAQDHPRQCVFVGTTNKDDWNRDETGARRFWPIACKGEIDIEGLKHNRGQMFAEAVHRLKQEETWWSMPAEATLEEQQKRYDADPWVEPINDFAEKGTLGIPLNTVTVNQLLTDCLKIDIGKITRGDQMRVATCLKVLGWKKGNRRQGRQVLKMWERSES